jgi:predicted ribosome quality control (RQC) complex YloA/Tae2 family protein
VILFQEGEHVSQFQKKLGKDYELNIATLHRSLPQDFDAFESADGDFKALFPTLGKEGAAYLDANGYATHSLNVQWELLQSTLEKMADPLISIMETTKGIGLSIFPIHGEALFQSHDAVEALNQFYSLHYSVGEFRREKSVLIELLSKQRVKAIHYLDTLTKQQHIRESNLAYEEIGNILMAFLHLIPAGAKSVELEDFYHGGTINIKLNALLSGPENAENYYRKAKNYVKEIAHRQENVDRKQAEIDLLGAQLTAIHAAENRKELKPYLPLLRTNAAAVVETADLPFKQFETDGWVIWVGKNAKNNDLLTLKYAKKFDIWLHARDVSGSHVVIRNPNQRTVPKHVVEKAAELAAHFSKRATESLCPVIVTAKKFVRKTKDLLPGQVIVDREEEVVLVKPTYWE